MWCVLLGFFSSKFVASVEVFGELHITIKCPTLYYKIKLNYQNSLGGAGSCLMGCSEQHFHVYQA